MCNSPYNSCLISVPVEYPACENSCPACIADQFFRINFERYFFSIYLAGIGDGIGIILISCLKLPNSNIFSLLNLPKPVPYNPLMGIMLLNQVSFRAVVKGAVNTELP